MQYQNPDLESSYRENDLGRDLYDAVLKYKPKKIIEFGSFYGYSTVSMAMALDELGGGEIHVYDLFDSYLFTHSAHKHTSEESLKKKGSLGYYLEAFRMDWRMWLRPARNIITKQELRRNLDTYGVGKYVTLTKKNFVDWAKAPEPFDFMHFDINNTGDKLRMLYKAVKPQIDQGAIVYVEGGSAERDQLSFMENHKLEKFSESGVPYTVVNENFPSLSVIRKV